MEVEYLVNGKFLKEKEYAVLVRKARRDKKGAELYI